MDLSPNTPIATLTVNDLNTPIRRQEIGKVNATGSKCMPVYQKLQIEYRNVESKRMKIIYHTSINQRKPGLSTLSSDKVDISAKEINYRRQGGPLHNDKRAIHPEDTAILNVCAPTVIVQNI